MPRLNILDLFFITVLAGLTVAFYKIISPFIIDIFLAIVLTHIFWRVFTWLRDRRGLRPKFAAGLTVLLIFFTIMLPVSVMTLLISQEVAGGYTLFRSRFGSLNSVMLLETIKANPALSGFLEDFSFLRLESRLNEFSRIATKTVFNSISSFLLNSSTIIAHFIVIHILAVPFFIYGQNLLQRIIDISPFSQEDSKEFVSEVVKILDATIMGTFIIGIVEGIFGGIMFAVFQLPSPIIWGTIMVVVSVIPLVGTNAVLWPAGVILIINGRVISGILIILLGFVAISASQHLLKPKLLGDRSGIHPVLILLSLIGGIIWLGPVGFIIGPLITGLFIVIWSQFAIRFRQELAARNAPRTTPRAAEAAASPSGDRLNRTARRRKRRHPVSSG